MPYSEHAQRGLFEPALEEMAATGSQTYGPKSFQQYVAAHFGDRRIRTADAISVDDRRMLSRELVQANAMVLRLGRTGKRYTDFALVAPTGGIDSFFLPDPTSELTEQTYLSKTPHRDLYAFEILPRNVEASLINLAFASGLLSRALNLDTPGRLPPPAKGSSTYTFSLRPHSTLDLVWRHNAGQVEIDALIVAERGGADVLFIFEAKFGRGARPVAKHKLVYPALGLAPRVPPDIPIVPVYLKLAATSREIVATIVECALPDPRQTLVAIDELTFARAVKLRLPIDLSLQALAHYSHILLVRYLGEGLRWMPSRQDA